MNKIIIVLKFITILLISSKTYSLSSSSYLIANSALLFFDYEKASSHYAQDPTEDFFKTDLEKKLLVFVNAGDLERAKIVAENILVNNELHEDAWLVYLTDAKINNNMQLLKEFKLKKYKNELPIVDYIFFDNNTPKKDNVIIAQSIFDVVRTSTQEYDNIENYDYFLFYLSLCLKLDKKHNEAHYYTAYIYEKLKDFEKAEYNYNKVSNDHYLYFESQKNIAINKVYQEKINEGEKNLLQLIKNNPTNEKLLLGLAEVYRLSKKYEKAISVYTDILNQIEIDEDQEWRIMYLRGICYERLDKWILAEKDLLKSLKINPDSPQVLNYLAYGWIDRDQFLDKSLVMLEKAYSKSPDSHYILDSLAWAHFKKNNLQLASKLMEDVLSMAPGEAISIDHLGDIYFAIGRKREAVYMWRQALDLATPEDNIYEKVEKKLTKFHVK